MRAALPLAAALLLGACAPQVPPATASQRAQVHVVMYATTWCPVCSRARDWFARRGIPYDEYDVESDPAAAARFRAMNPAGSVPVINVEGRVIVGFVAEDVRRAIDTVAHERYPEDAEAPAPARSEPAESEPSEPEPARTEPSDEQTSGGQVAGTEPGVLSESEALPEDE